MALDKADLYLLSSNSFSDQINFCCRLTEKALSHGHSIHIQTEESIQNEALNDALWSFKADSFLPHAVGQNQFKSHPITIDTVSISSNNEGHRDLLILLNTSLPSNYKDFNRLSIVVINQPDKISEARALYKQLKTGDVDVAIHDLRKAS